MSTTNERLDIILNHLKPVLDASLDAICILDGQLRIVHLNMAMKSFLRIRLREGEPGPVFSELLSLTTGRLDEELRSVLERDFVLQLDELPGLKGKEKLRFSLRAVALRESQNGLGALPQGIFVTLRDTTGEVLLQAKYHKLLEISAQQEARISELKKAP